MRNKHLLWLLLLVLVTVQTQAQHEVQMSQYMFNGLTLNPALAGSHNALNAQVLYRAQWLGMRGAPQSQVASVDGTITQSNSMGWGVSVVGDQIGKLSTLGAYANYSYRIKLNSLDDRLALGLAAGAMQQAFSGVDGTSLTYRGGNLYDPDDDELLGAQTRWIPEFRLGAYYNMGRALYVGLSASNLGTLLDTLRNPYMYLNLGTNIDFAEKWTIAPSMLLTFPMQERATLDINLAAKYSRFWLGVGLRMAMPTHVQANTEALNALSIMAEIWITNELRIGYAYDYSLGRVSALQNGSHEISLGYTFARKITTTVSPRGFR
ncbi:MAG: PorP/SprF family type IX secretion system membrane protein [Bacteroidales bacterium]